MENYTNSEFKALGSMGQRQAIAKRFKGYFASTDLRKLKGSERKSVWAELNLNGFSQAERLVKSILETKHSVPPEVKIDTSNVQVKPPVYAGEPETSEPETAGLTPDTVIPEPVKIDKGPSNGDFEALNAALASLLGKGSVDRVEVEKIIDDRLKGLQLPRKIVVRDVKTLETKDVGLQHYLFEDLLDHANYRENVWLTGPAGSGKTFVCHAIADALGLEFYAQSVGSQTTKSDLLGYNDANGNYVESILYKAYKFGGLYLLDEADAGNSNVLTILNALLANGSYRFPNGELVKMSDDFVCFAAANTFGRGADRLYVGRNQIDAATLDRFVNVTFDYDERLERALSGNDAWVDIVQSARKKAFDLKERVVISPRASIKGAAMLERGIDIETVKQRVLWKGIQESIIRKLS